MQQMHKYIIRR